jgi:hypothetical protein
LDFFIAVFATGNKLKISAMPACGKIHENGMADGCFDTLDSTNLMKCIIL